jgi:hypothetical protein
VEIGHRSSVLVEIVRGIDVGDEVIVFPSDEIGSGVGVKSRTTAKEAT